jgi:hypothetical protein
LIVTGCAVCLRKPAIGQRAVRIAAIEIGVEDLPEPRDVAVLHGVDVVGVQ